MFPKNPSSPTPLLPHHQPFNILQLLSHNRQDIALGISDSQTPKTHHIQYRDESKLLSCLNETRGGSGKDFTTNNNTMHQNKKRKLLVTTNASLVKSRNRSGSAPIGRISSPSSTSGNGSVLGGNKKVSSPLNTVIASRRRQQSPQQQQQQHHTLHNNNTAASTKNNYFSSNSLGSRINSRVMAYDYQKLQRESFVGKQDVASLLRNASERVPSASSSGIKSHQGPAPRSPTTLRSHHGGVTKPSRAASLPKLSTTVSSSKRLKSRRYHNGNTPTTPSSPSSPSLLLQKSRKNAPVVKRHNLSVVETSSPFLNRHLSQYSTCLRCGYTVPKEEQPFHHCIKENRTKEEMRQMERNQRIASALKEYERESNLKTSQQHAAGSPKGSMQSKTHSRLSRWSNQKKPYEMEDEELTLSYLDWANERKKIWDHSQSATTGGAGANSSED